MWERDKGRGSSVTLSHIQQIVSKHLWKLTVNIWKCRKVILNESITNEKRWKHCGERRDERICRYAPKRVWNWENVKTLIIQNIMVTIESVRYSGFHLTLSLIRQFCNRRLWTYFVKKKKILLIEWITYDLKWKTLWQKEKLLILSNFFFIHYVFKKPSAAEASESIYMRVRVNYKFDILLTEFKHKICLRE